MFAIVQSTYRRSIFIFQRGTSPTDTMDKWPSFETLKCDKRRSTAPIRYYIARKIKEPFWRIDKLNFINTWRGLSKSRSPSRRVCTQVHEICWAAIILFY